MSQATQSTFLSSKSTRKSSASSARRRASGKSLKKGSYELSNPWRFALWVVSVGIILCVVFYGVMRRPPSEAADIPVIKAQQGPIRLPPHPNQESFDPDQHQIYKRLERSSLDDPSQPVEQLLPPVEAPILDEPQTPPTPSASHQHPVKLPKDPHPASQTSSKGSGPPVKKEVPAKTKVIPGEKPRSTLAPAPSSKAQKHASIDHILHRTTSQSAPDFKIQLGPFRTKQEALQVLAVVKRQTLQGFSQGQQQVRQLSPSKHVILLKGFSTLKEAQESLTQLQARKIATGVLQP